MEKRIRLRIDAQGRYDDACASNRSTFDATQGGKDGLAALGVAVTGTKSWLAAYEGKLEAEATAVNNCRTWRTLLQKSLAAMVKISRFVGLDDSDAQVVRLPDKGVSDDQLIAQTTAIQDKVTAKAPAFLAKGLPDTVLQNLPAQIAGLEAAKAARMTARTQRKADAKMLRQSLKDGDAAIALLHAIAAHTPGLDSHFLAQLVEAKRVGPVTAGAAPAAPAAPPASEPSATPKTA
ncbi:MAG TPA: hypothetical protein VEU08_01225 [Vicinamibacterales bacterium]|nr:hypothetical protein [Vicinamibacterales bacterium]